MVANARIYHVPALLDEVMGTLQPQGGRKYIDCTLGEGSVTEALLSSGAKVLGIDADPEMITMAARRLAGAPNATYTLVQANFASLKEVAFAQGFTEVDGIIMDVGLFVSADPGHQTRFHVPERSASGHAVRTLGRSHRGRPRE